MNVETHRIKFVGTLQCAPCRAPRICQIFAILMVNKDNGGPTVTKKTWTLIPWKYDNHHYRSNRGFQIRLSAVEPLLWEMFRLKNSRNDEYFSHRHICKLHCTHCRRVSCRDETTKCLNWFLLDSFKANNCFLLEGKKFSASLQKLFLPFSEPFVFISHDAVTQCLLLFLNLFVSL